MTYGEAKKRLYKLLDEPKPGPALLERLTAFFDLGQREIAKSYPLLRCKQYGPEDERVLPQDFYRPSGAYLPGGVPVELRALEGRILDAPERFTLEYQAWPAAPAEDGDELDLPPEALPALLYFVAAKCQEMEYDQRYFQNFFSEYQGQMTNLAAQPGVVARVVGPAVWM